MKYDIVVVGAGHAGCEAAIISANAGFSVALITPNLKNIADMACNPSIGGSAKGIVVREIDALGGVMGKIADKAILQLKMLNYKKGPGVRSLRAQVDKVVYQNEMIKYLNQTHNLEIIESMVTDLITDKQTVKGVMLENNKKILSKVVILTTGTYLNSRILIGSESKTEGPHGERTDSRLSKSLINNGFQLQRLKTGTPPIYPKKTSSNAPGPQPLSPS